MGKIADLIMEGVLCEVCGGYVGEPSDYPRTCPNCLRCEEAEK